MDRTVYEEVTMSLSIPFPAQVEFEGDRHVARWRPLVQWILAIPHIAIASALRSLRQILTLISLVTVLFTKQIPRSLFNMITMSYRYEWRAMSYAMFMHDDYPPFDFEPTSADNGLEPHARLSIAYPEHLDQWSIQNTFSAIFVSQCDSTGATFDNSTQATNGKNVVISIRSGPTVQAPSSIKVQKLFTSNSDATKVEIMNYFDF